VLSPAKISSVVRSTLPRLVVDVDASAAGNGAVRPTTKTTATSAAIYLALLRVRDVIFGIPPGGGVE